ncbi:MAG: rubrerythrin family protein [Akkermansia sp.]
MKSIKGTETEKNLLKAFAGESEARNHDTYFAGVAKKAGYEQIAAIFLETADNEKEHAKVFFKLLKDACIEVTHAVCTAPLESTEDCLLAAAAGEHDEWSTCTPRLPRWLTVKASPPLRKPSASATVEQHHEARYLKLAENVREGKVAKEKEISGSAATAVTCHRLHRPKVCPACVHPRRSLKNWRTTNRPFSRNMIGAGFTS